MRTTLLTLAALATIAVLGAPAASAMPAGAARANPYTAKEVCGSGYRVLKVKRLRDDGIRLGRIVLLWNGSTGKNCVATIKVHQPGTPDYVQAFLQVRGRATGVDDGPFKYYAGPVRASARGKCVKWGGNITIAEGVGDGHISRWGHCGG